MTALFQIELILEGRSVSALNKEKTEVRLRRRAPSQSLESEAVALEAKDFSASGF